MNIYVDAYIVVMQCFLACIQKKIPGNNRQFGQWLVRNK